MDVCTQADMQEFYKRMRNTYYVPFLSRAVSYAKRFFHLSYGPKIHRGEEAKVALFHPVPHA
jgi:hypothetical protein